MLAITINYTQATSKLRNLGLVTMASSPQMGWGYHAAAVCRQPD